MYESDDVGATESITHPMRRPDETLPSYDRFVIIVQLCLGEACRSELKKVYVCARDSDDGQFRMFCSQCRDELRVDIHRFAIHHLVEVGKQLWRIAGAIVLDEGEIVCRSHVGCEREG